ncbi:glycosyltransferase family 4 protein [Geobacter sulfurreducens]|uniref:glycosyltransferase family 4 protein n=1 Tax=Geobacter sulfurreducens TaxID=35554 RepID=UPI001BDCCE4A|nr:glycosyltransferase family 4 protein [Geobacter sulfurreducens]QVW33917.1 glycosyltransferase family 4 protein [Geobacter sulfurreducens]
MNDAPVTAKVPRVMDLRGTYKGGGGPDKTVLNSAARHDPTRVHVLVTYLRQPWDHEFQIPDMARRLGINYVDVPDGSMIDRTCLRSLAALIREHRLEVVHAHDDKTLLYAWLLRLMMPGLKIMYTCHSHAVYGRCDFTGLGEYLNFKVRQRIQILLMKRYLKPVITVSRETRGRLTANGLPDKDVAVLHNGIDIDVWRRDNARPVLRHELGIPDDGLLVGTVARITYDKDLPTFYRVAELVARRVPGVTFVIVGDGYGDELQRAREEVTRRGLERLIRFTGHRNDLKDIYSSFDVFLMTSLTEGMPNTLLEAMALGVPSVSTSVGGVPELLEHGDGGFLAPVGDADSLADQVTALLVDPSLRSACGKACRRRIEERFDFARRVDLMEDYYAWFAGMGPLPSHTMS